MPRHWIARFIAVAVVGVLGTWAPWSVRPVAADSTTEAGGVLRDGWFSNEASLSPQTVQPGSFGQLYATAVDGQVYAQPITFDGTVVVATENDAVEGIDETTGAVEWSRHLGTPWNASDIGCSDISPTVGVTGTPVVDPATGVVYLVTKSYVAGDSGASQFEMHALYAATGKELPDWPVVIGGTASNDPNSVFSPTTLIQRPALLLMGDVVYAAFGGFCDSWPFQGWVAGVSTTTAEQSALWTSEADSGIGQGGSIWQTGDGLMSDGPGQIVFSTGNGTTPGSVPGKSQPPQDNLGQSIVRLTVQPDGSLRQTDFFAPHDAAALNPGDLDLGSGGVAALPDQMGTTADPHLLVQGGKSGTLYLLDRDDLGGQGQGAGDGDAAVDEFGNNGGVFSTPAAWPGDGGWLYSPTTGSPGEVNNGGGKFYAYQEQVDGSGDPSFVEEGASSDIFGYGSSSAVVSSDGTQSGSALVWVVHRDHGDSGAQLRAYDAVPVGGVMEVQWSAPVTTPSKFEAPAVDAGRVFLGTGGGELLAFGPLSDAPPLSGAQLDFGPVQDGTAVHGSAVLTASGPVTVASVTTTDPQFVAGAPVPPLPAALGTGDELTVPVTYTPDAPGTTDASLVLTGSDGSTSTLSLTGTGTIPPDAPVATPGSLDFGVPAVGSGPFTLPLVLTNDTAQTVTVTGSQGPSAPFSVGGLPGPGTTIAPAGTLTVHVTFDPPSNPGSYGDLLGIDTDAGLTSVPLVAATVSGSPGLTLDTQRVDFGAVDDSTVASHSLEISNPGIANLTVAAEGLPGGGFSASTDAPGAVITVYPRQHVALDVRFAPPGVGPSSATLTLTGNDGSGPHDVSLAGLGIPAGTVSDPSLGGWVDNGGAAQDGPSLDLTDASTAFEVGSAFWPTPIDGDGLTVDFDATIGGGSGADGMALVLADPSAGPTALGGTGGALGFAGIDGVAVGLDTYPDDRVGIAQGSADGLPNWVSIVPSPVPLREGAVQVEVTLSSGTLTVSLDGHVATSAVVTLPPTVLLGFSAGNGAFTDAHTVSEVSVTTDAGQPPPDLADASSLPMLVLPPAVVMAGALWHANRRRTRPRRRARHLAVGG